MYKLTIESHFDAAHALRGYRGRCENTHGHRFRAVAHFTTHCLDDIGLGADFAELKKALNEVLERFDHADLSTMPPFDIVNPSSENLATTIYSLLESKTLPAQLSSVEVWESPDAGVEYRPDGELI
ncbi:MAG: 6-carboxytetrahydropterin synthase [Dehalococcoidia bacterium]|nr:6-carboxytetrahydropterin synthase [Dehalococcoidia bacterium]